jgi:hypothetical protein
MKRHLCLTSILLCICTSIFAQDIDSTLQKITDFPNRLFLKIKNKTASLDEALTKQTAKYLQKLAKREARMQRKLAKTDSVAAKNLFAGVQGKYLAYEKMIKSQMNNPVNANTTGEYIPYLDSIKSSLSFLQQNNKILNSASSNLTGPIGSSLAHVNQLQAKLQQTEEIKEFIRQRKQQLRDEFSRYVNASGLKKYMDAYNKNSYYYGAKLKEYKDALNDPDRLEKKALTLLNKLPAFKDFMKKNSILASLFRMPPDDPNDPAYLQSLAGLQTRTQLAQFVQQQFAGPSPSGMQQIRQNMQGAQSELQQLKDKLNQSGGSSTDEGMPDFRPNSQKTKTLLQRIAIETNMQTQQSSTLFPVTSDLGLSLAYKLDDKKMFGIGASYKLGWGQNIQHVNITQQGAGLRSFVDWKLKSSLWLSGGFEMNYRTVITGLSQLKNLSAWQRSGLLGLSKKLDVKTKIFKNTSLSLLWDFLSYSQVPRTSPLVFRVGYGLK